ncbi:hypothetical protein Tco_1473785 [Tanacetum coccineum]
MRQKRYKTYMTCYEGANRYQNMISLSISIQRLNKNPSLLQVKEVKATAKEKSPLKESKQPALGLETPPPLSRRALTEGLKTNLKLATKQSLIQTHSSHASSSGTHEGTGVIPGVPDVPTYRSDDEEIPWKSNNDGDEFVHPKFTTHDDEARQEAEVNEEDSFDPRVRTPSRTESIDDDETQGVNVEGEKMDEDATNIEGEGIELYRDVNVNLEGRDAEITDAHQTIAQTNQVIEDTHVIITPVNPEGQQQSSFVSSGFVSNMLNPNPDLGIDSIFNFNTEATSLVDVPVTTLVESPILSAITLPPPSTPFILNLQQTPVPSPAIFPSSSLQDLPNFGSLFRFDHRLKTLETKFSEYKQTNQFAKSVYSIPSIVDAYLANKMNEAVKTVVQLQSNKLRDEAQAKNEDFLTKLDDNIKKIIKDQVK